MSGRLTAYIAASKVLDHDPNTTREEARIAEDAGLVEWDIDIEGFLPGATNKFNFCTELFYDIDFYAEV